MKKFLNIILIGLIGISAAGCNKYFISENTSNDSYYGAYNRRDMTWADVVVYKKESDKRCEGVVHLNAPTRSITMKNDRVDAIMKLACTDGTLININWQLRKGSFADGFGEGVDQYNNSYRFKTVSKGEFQQAADENVKIKIPSDSSLLKY